MIHIINIIVIFISYNNMPVCKDTKDNTLLYLTVTSYCATLVHEDVEDVFEETIRLLSYPMIESNCGLKLKSARSNACGAWHLMPKWHGECSGNWFKEAKKALDVCLDFRRMCTIKNEPGCYRKGQALCRKGEDKLCRLDNNTYNKRYKSLKRKVSKNKQKFYYKFFAAVEQLVSITEKNIKNQDADTSYRG